LGGVFHFLGISPKNGFFGLFSAKIGPLATSSIYSESAQKSVAEKIHLYNQDKPKNEEKYFFPKIPKS
jgi:hypothetical protein